MGGLVDGRITLLSLLYFILLAEFLLLRVTILSFPETDRK